MSKNYLHQWYMSGPTGPTEPTVPAGGNTNPPLKERKEFIENQAKNWCFTVFAEEGEDLKTILDQLVQVVQDPNKYIFGLEVCPKTKREHLQCFVALAKKARLQTLLGHFPNYKKWHKSVCKGNLMDNYIYCAKEKKFVSNIKIPKSIGALKKKEITLYGWQLDLMEDIKKCATNSRDILWVYDYIGKSGKNCMCEFLVEEYGAVIMGGADRHIKAQVMANQECEIFIINVTREGAENVSYSAIEAVRDGIFASYFGCDANGMVRLKHYPVVIIFSNNTPDHGKLSADRWQLREINKEKRLIKWQVSKGNIISSND